MTHLCKHCATPYTERSGLDGFCCPGCKQVYLLIQAGGLGEYYRLQDRAAQPFKDRILTDVDVAALHSAQVAVEAGAESGQAVFEVEGMSCMGCAWLVERLAASQAGLTHGHASLSRHTLSLEWRSGEFDLSALGSELFKFGYRLSSNPGDFSHVPRISPLTLRVLLSLVFTGNALLLAAYQRFVVPMGDGVTLIHLLSLICLCFTLLLGAAPFCMSVYRASKIRRWHSDWLPIALLVVGVAYVSYAVGLLRLDLSLGVFLISLLVSVLIGARWLGLALFKS